jgi:hypothetical protein
LTTFEWDAEELPPDDDMWFSLRMGCPRLRHVSTSVGFELPIRNSHAFDFVDLIGFSLSLKPGYYKNHVDLFLDDDMPGAKNIWSMLKRSPNLEELAITGSSLHPTDAHQLVAGRWPKLRKLALGDVIIDWQTAMADPDAKRPFIAFLEAHDTLESISLSKHNIHHTRLSNLSTDALPCLKDFTGTLEQFQVLHRIHPSLKSVTFCDPMLTRELTPLAVAVALQNLRNLTKLKVSFVLDSMYDSASLLRSLFTACPMLEHLELTCAHKPSFQLESFSKHVGNFSKLRYLSLTIVRYPGDETISSGASRIARASPRLETFKLTFLPARQPLPLLFALPYLSILPPTRATGTYDLKCDVHGLPLSLTAREKHRVIWPWGFGMYNWSKRYSRDLRPTGYPGWKKDGENVLRLVLDRSAAGEEVRMILVCVLLVCVAVWGVVGSGSASGQRWL